MALQTRGNHRYGDDHADIRTEIERYSRSNGYEAQHFRDAGCTCGSSTFRVLLDDVEGAAVRCCVTCDHEHPMGDSEEYLEGADLGECECPCGNGTFQVTAGVSLYSDSNAVRWLYLGFRCTSCGLTAVYGDWKNEFEDYREFLNRI